MRRLLEARPQIVDIADFINLNYWMCDVSQPNAQGVCNKLLALGCYLFFVPDMTRDLAALDVYKRQVHQAVALDRQNRENRQHLSAAAPGRAAVGEEVPTEVYDQYRKFFPDLSSKDIRKHYAKSK